MKANTIYISGKGLIMKVKAGFVVMACILLIAGCEQAQVGDMIFAEGIVQHVMQNDQLQWMPCPTDLPSGCEVVVLEGNPQSSDLFTVRFRLSEDFVMSPHSHPKDERVTIINGKLSIAFGVDGTRENAKQFRTGDYYVNAREEIHTVWADTVSIIQITGIGPWEANFAENISQ
jgi:quercetin dioxygenase-like cupin family protein